MPAPPPPYVTNERVKSVARTLFQLGSALFAAGVVRAYSIARLSPETLGWLFVGVTLIWAGWLVLDLLEPEG